MLSYMQNQCGDNDKQVRDHAHRTGCFCGVAHGGCNITDASDRRLFLAMFHNLKVDAFY